MRIPHPANNTNELGPAGNYHIHGKKKIAFSYSNPGGTLKEIKQPKTLI